MTKRIVIFLDGTWNLLSAAEPTNVVLTAQMVLPYGEDEKLQLIYYKQGVGTSFLINQRIESWLAGALGLGVFDNIAEAYRFLAFNYQTGDEIFVFGFSRGAFTARSLVSLIRLCGIVNSDRAVMVDKALDLFRWWNREGGADGDTAQRFRAENSPETIMADVDRDWRRANGFSAYEELPNFTIRYLGVWDTVSALGVPRHLPIRGLFQSDERYEFDSAYLTRIVEASRHAVAIHEDRLSFTPMLIENIDDLNAVPGREGNHRQLWFPGDHGSVGGGGDIRGLSHYALLWMLEGAAKMGLGLDEPAMENALLKVDHRVSTHNSTKKAGWLDRLYRRKPRAVPADRALLSESAIKRMLWEDEGRPPPPSAK
jgi:uncharacterized protein (DUF2235 family)